MRKFVLAVLVAGMVLTGAQVAQAATNDDFANAIDISASLPYGNSSDNITDTREVGEPDACVPAGSTEWYKITPATSGVFAADTAGSDFDTVLAVYAGTSFADLRMIACNDDAAHYANDLTSILTFHARAGEPTFIQVGGYDNQPAPGVTVPAPELPGPNPLAKHGVLKFHVAVANPPANDDFADATSVTALPFAETPTLQDSSFELDEPMNNCMLPWISYTGSVWYAVAVPATGVISIASERSHYSTLVEAYSGTELNALQFLDCDWGDNLTFSPTANPGDTVYLRVSSTRQTYGDLTITVQAGSDVAPENDNFENATVITSIPSDMNVDTTSATMQAGEPETPCGPTGHTVWYALDLAKNQSVSMYTEGPPSVLTVYRGSSLDSLEMDSCYGYGFDLRAPTAGRYYVQLGGADVTGDGRISAGLFHVVVYRQPQSDLAVTGLTVKPTPFDTDLGTVPSGIRRTINFRVSDLGPDELNGEAMLYVEACPATHLVGCDQISNEWIHLSVGETITREINWTARGVGDYTIVASIYSFGPGDSDPSNDEQRANTYSIIGGTGVGAGVGNCAVVVCL